MKLPELLIVSFVILTIATAPAGAKSIDEEAPILAESLAKQLVAKQRPKIAVLDFTNIQGNANELGRFLSEQLAVDLVSQEGVTLLDRANINSVMAEHQLTAEGLVKPENAKKLGEFAGVDALLIGSLASMDQSFVLTVKAISTDTAEIVAAGRCKFDVTEDLMKQFSSSIGASTQASGGSSNTNNQNPTSRGTNVIATQKIDNLEVNLNAIALSSARIRQRYGDEIEVKVINCSFEFINRDLNGTIAIAANGLLELNGNRSAELIAETGYRGGMFDDKGSRWWLPKGSLRGLPSVMCFETISGGVLGNYAVQNNPGSIVSYIKSGKKTEFGTANQNGVSSTGKYWAGSFSPLEPGKSIRVNALYYPDLSIKSDNYNDTPESLNLDLELITAMSEKANADDHKALKNIRLQNVTFENIVTPSLNE